MSTYVVHWREAASGCEFSPHNIFSSAPPSISEMKGRGHRRAEQRFGSTNHQEDLGRSGPLGPVLDLKLELFLVSLSYKSFLLPADVRLWLLSSGLDCLCEQIWNRRTIMPWDNLAQIACCELPPQKKRKCFKECRWDRLNLQIKS